MEGITKIPRERGTLQDTLPKPYVPLVLFWIMCTATAVYTHYYSFIQNVNSIEDTIIISLQAGLGVASSMYSVVYSDPFVHLFSYTIDLLLSKILSGEHILNLDTVQKLTIPTLVLVLSLFSSFRYIFCRFLGSQILVNQTNLLCLYSISFITFLIGSSKDMISPNIQYSLSPSILVSLASFLVLFKYFQKRTHKNGNLTVNQNGSSVVVGVTIIYTTLLFVPDTTSAINLMPFLLGTAVSTGFIAIFAGVADVWHVIGTGQFQMISLDTVGIVFYFLLPLVVLGLRFVDKYGDFLHRQCFIISELIVQVADPFLLKIPFKLDGHETFSSLLLNVLMITVVGIPLVKSLCPISGHLFGQVYVHGNPSTKRTAICLHYSSLYSSDIPEVSRENIFQILNTWKKGEHKNISSGLLNILVSVSELESCGDILKNLSSMGHEIVLTLDKNESCSSLSESCMKYEAILGHKPLWYHTGIESKGSSPCCFSIAKKLGMRSVMWSLYLNSSATLDPQVLSNELKGHNGGSFVYLSEDNMSIHLLKDILNTLKDEGKFLPTTLSFTAQQTSKMKL